MDNQYVFVPIEQTQKLLGLKSNEVYALELKTDREPEEVVEKIKKSLGNQFTVKTKTALNEAFYKILNTEKLAAYAIFTLVIVVALFNLTGAMIMSILDKKHNLKTLYNLGTNTKDIRAIFSNLGFMITLLGMFFWSSFRQYCNYITTRIQVGSDYFKPALPCSFQMEQFILGCLNHCVFGLDFCKDGHT